MNSDVSRVLLIANPMAARTGQRAVTTVTNILRGTGWDLEVRTTEGPGHARELAEYGVRQRVDMVAVLGGDGTTMQAAAALVGTDVLLGVIPGGTGNLLAGNLRIPGTPARAARALLTAEPQRIDLGRMERPFGWQYFAVACGAGYDARVMAATMSRHKRRWGMAAYVATSLRLMPDLRSTQHVITIDGTQYQAHAAMVLVANCGEVIPPFVRLAPGITPTDGLLDVIVIRADNFSQSVRAVWRLLRVGPSRLGAEAFVAHAQGREVRVESERVQPVQLDGEPGGETPFTATVVPGAIRTMIPRASRGMA